MIIKSMKKKINYYISNQIKLTQIKQKININKNLVLFNSEKISKDIEKAYEKIWNNFINGKKIADLQIK